MDLQTMQEQYPIGTTLDVVVHSLGRSETVTGEVTDYWRGRALVVSAGGYGRLVIPPNKIQH